MSHIPQLRAKRVYAHLIAILIRDFSPLTQSHLFSFIMIFIFIRHSRDHNSLLHSRAELTKRETKES